MLGIVGGRVELQLLTTLKCNLKCSYCSLGVGEVLGSQVHVAYDIEQLCAFVDKHLLCKEVYVTFYRGEPTLNKPLMLEVMQRFPHFRFQLQTNATLISKLPDQTLSRLSNVLASIDGDHAEEWSPAAQFVSGSALASSATRPTVAVQSLPRFMPLLITPSQEMPSIKERSPPTRLTT